jgi:hypothetical protein
VRNRSVLMTAACLLCGVLVVHQLRYVLAFGQHAERTLADHGHGYLAVLAPLLGSAGALLLARWLARLAAGRSGVARSAIRWRTLWPAASVAVLALYGSQELLEGALAHGHPAGLDAIFAGSGWIAVPLALAVGALLALVPRIARSVESAVGARAPWTARNIIWAPLVVVRSVPSATSAENVLAVHRAGRGPPAIASS